MQQTRKTPTFNMKAVVRETGIRPDTLRAWERRYDLPNPQRTAGGHRIYSQRDVDILRWLMARQDEGLSISHAVELFKRLEAEGQDPILASGYGSPGEGGEVKATRARSDSIQELLEDWLAACRAFDEQGADRILAEAFALFPVEQVCTDLIQQGMTSIGESWYEGETTVQQEHFASALVMRRLNSLLATSPAPARPGKLLLGCPPTEEHTLGLMIMAVLLRRRSLDVVYLGANVPIDKMSAMIGEVRPRLAVFQAQQLTSAAELGDLGTFLHDAQVPMAYGGRIFVNAPSLQARITGHYLGDELLASTANVERLMGRNDIPDPVEPLSEVYMAAINHFGSRKPALESALATTLAVAGQSPAQFADAGDFLTRNITAALKLGDLELVAPEIEWIAGLLNTRDLDPSLLAIYLNAYRQALMDTLDQRGQIVIDWFTGFLSRL